MVVLTTPTNGFRTSYESRDFVTKAFVVIGTVYHAPTPDALEVLHNVVIAVGDDGCISAIHDADTKTARELVSSSEVVVRLGTSERLLPGLIDTHIHAPQWPQLGTGLDISLDKWLFEYTFPLEAKYADAGFAHEVWHQMVPTMLRHGTTRLSTTHQFTVKPQPCRLRHVLNTDSAPLLGALQWIIRQERLIGIAMSPRQVG